MSQSENINELAAALSKAQGEMPPAIKDSTNPFFKSKYADLGSIKDAAQPSLTKHGLCVIHTTELCSDRNQVILVTTLAHSSGQWMKSHLPLNPTKNDSQGMGAAMTYLRRYAFSAMVGVVCDEDDDGETAVGRGKSTPQAKETQKPAVSNDAEEKIANKDVSVLVNLIEQLDEESSSSFFSWIKKTFNASSVQDIPKDAFNKCLVSVNAKIKYLKDQDRVVA